MANTVEDDIAKAIKAICKRNSPTDAEHIIELQKTIHQTQSEERITDKRIKAAMAKTREELRSIESQNIEKIKCDLNKALISKGYDADLTLNHASQTTKPHEIELNEEIQIEELITINSQELDNTDEYKRVTTNRQEGK